MKTLTKPLKVTPIFTSYIAGIKSVSDFYELPNSLPWVFGISGHAFIMNIHDELCPSGPTFFSTRPINTLLKNIGLTCYGKFFNKPDADFSSKQETAFLEFQKAIDFDMPSLVWEMDLPEYYIAIGYDDENYIYLDLQGNQRAKKWDTLGTGSTGMVGFITPMPQEPAPDDRIAVKEALSFALRFAKHPKDWTYPSYSNGLKAYDTWINALESGKVNPFGLAYNTIIWAECRKYAHEFLLEAKAKLHTDLFDDAIEHFEVVAWSLGKVSKLFPFPPVNNKVDDDALDDALDELFLASEAEKAGLPELKRIIELL